MAEFNLGFNSPQSSNSDKGLGLVLCPLGQVRRWDGGLGR